MPEGGEGPVEVRIKLVIDDESEATISRMKEGLKSSNEEIKKGGEGAKGMAFEFLKGGLELEGIKRAAEAVTDILEESVKSMYEFGEAAAEAADELNRQVRTQAGAVTFMDQNRHSFEDILTYQRGIKDELDKTGIVAGETGQDINAAYQAIIERGNMGTERAKELTEQMAIVGKVARGGMEGLAQGFAMMELGVVHARNPLVQLIAATQTLHGNAHSVAAALQKMTPAKQMEIAEKAISKQAEMMKGQAAFTVPTLSELGVAFRNIRENFLEAVGEPMLHHIIPVLTKVRDYFVEHAEEVENFATRIGAYISEVIDAVSAAASGIYDAISHNYKEIEDAFTDLTNEWKNAWGISLGDTDSIRKTFMEMTKTLIDAFATALKYAKATLEVFEDVKDIFTGKTAGTTGAESARAAAATGTMSVGGGAEGEKQFDLAINRYIAMAKDVADSAAESARIADVTHMQTDEIDKTHAAALANIEAQAAKLRAEHESFNAAADEAAQTIKTHNFEAFSTYLNSAIEVTATAHNDAQEKYALSLIAGNDDAVAALAEGKIKIAGGLDAFSDTIRELSPELAKELDELKNKIKHEGGVKPVGHYNDFRGSTFQIHQDFRDQDPNRVAIILRKDILQAAKARGQSRLATPFGL